MLFRRIKAHIEKENWFAVFIDFLIVVIGVFMGFQVQAWSEHRNDVAETQEYLQRLVTDMQLSVDRNNHQINQSQRQVEKLDLIISVLEDCELPPESEQTFIGGLYSLGKYDMPVMMMGTINELNSTGKFALIKDISLRDLISESIREHEVLWALDQQVLGRSLPGINYVQSHVRFNLAEHKMTSDAIDSKLVTLDFSELCDDKKFINSIATVRDMRLATKLFGEQSVRRQLALIEALENNLSKDKQ